MHPVQVYPHLMVKTSRDGHQQDGPAAVAAVPTRCAQRFTPTRRHGKAHVVHTDVVPKVSRARYWSFGRAFPSCWTSSPSCANFAVQWFVRALCDPHLFFETLNSMMAKSARKSCRLNVCANDALLVTSMIHFSSRTRETEDPTSACNHSLNQEKSHGAKDFDHS